MAVYFQLAIDCGKQHILADNISKGFNSLSIELDGILSVKCRAGFAQAENGHWTVGIWPRGAAYNSPDCTRVELLDNQRLIDIQEALFKQLREFSGYQLAIFGAETVSWLDYLEWPLSSNDFEMKGLIWDEKLLDESAKPANARRFAEGYSWNPNNKINYWG